MPRIRRGYTVSTGDFPVLVQQGGEWIHYNYCRQSCCFFSERFGPLARDVVLEKASFGHVQMHNSRFWFLATPCGLQACIDAAHAAINAIQRRLT